MDIILILTGFFIGVSTGAAGSYFGNKYTDQHRAKASDIKERDQWDKLLKRYPKIINEMINDIKGPQSKNIRTFFVKKSAQTLNSPGSLVYHIDKHANLNAAIMYMEEIGYIKNITTGNFPKYQILDHFYQKLKKARQH